MNGEQSSSPTAGQSGTSFGEHFALPRDPTERNRLLLALLGLAVIVYAYGIAKTCIVNNIPVSLVRWLFYY